eukprot:jgi/Botrbrau1/1159/Bobra.0162s0047.1
MQMEWGEVKCETVDWRESGTRILRSPDQAQALLEDHLMKLGSMRASPYITHFLERLLVWDRKLNLTQEVLDEWLKCQQGWVYLEPIFGSEDILQQMPNEGRKFRAVDAAWRRVMTRAALSPELLSIAADEELLKTLLDCNKLLDQVQEGLNVYLESKRLAFPRFFFLSNDELLDVLSESRDPLRAQPYMRKIFEGVDHLHFEPNLDVTGMYSEEGELLPLLCSFNPGASNGAVERWFNLAETAMRDSVRSVIEGALHDHAACPRLEWLLRWPGQAVLCIDSLIWTHDVTVAIQDRRLPQFATKCTEELLEVVNRVRGTLTKLERKTLSALIVIDVHARDVVTALQDRDVQQEDDFEWTSQLRYTINVATVLVIGHI